MVQAGEREQPEGQKQDDATFMWSSMHTAASPLFTFGTSHVQNRQATTTITCLVRAHRNSSTEGKRKKDSCVESATFVLLFVLQSSITGAQDA